MPFKRIKLHGGPDRDACEKVAQHMREFQSMRLNNLLFRELWNSHYKKLFDLTFKVKSEEINNILGIHLPESLLVRCSAFDMLNFEKGVYRLDGRVVLPYKVPFKVSMQRINYDANKGHGNAEIIVS